MAPEISLLYQISQAKRFVMADTNRIARGELVSHEDPVFKISCID